jgi:hypothetical protein
MRLVNYSSIMGSHPKFNEVTKFLLSGSGTNLVNLKFIYVIPSFGKVMFFNFYRERRDFSFFKNM